MDTLATVKDIAAIVLMGAGAILLLALAMLIIKVSPAISCFARNMEKIAGNAADAGPNVVAASENIKEITGNMVGASKDISEATPSLRQSALNIEKATGSISDASPNIVAISENIKEITENQKDAAGYATSAIKDIAEATPLLRLLGPAGRMANFAKMGIGKLGGFIRGVFRR